MVGKIKHVRQKLHQEAVRLERPSSLSQRPGSGLPQSLEKPPASELHKTSAPILENKKTESSTDAAQPLGQISFPSGIFAGTKITAEALVQTLRFEEPPDAPPPARTGPEEKKVKSKKEKMKERRERWLNKISSIKQAKEQQAAEARRQATPVVGDMRPLADALPELSLLVAPRTTALTARRKSRKNKVPVKRPEPTDFSQMKQSQKRKLLETETSRFSNAVKTLSAKMNPLADIGEQLRKRMRQEEEQGPS
ncbi:ribosome biogenesis protein SLX9 homolog [Gasterosteus aculeatus]|uniref:Family with sequence similarity 207 member A n=1 Tax=Gasterosteus aculeatus aculeatus TaxID=481459 RepID=A0AAQ4R4F1_GASAC|nr:protein FAM207A [Gasterosteus aculeatus aculeatus]